nr:ATP synthase B chain precursor [Synarthrophyton patena]
MINLIFISLSFLFLVNKKVILLNEEILILICFITFVYLSFNYISKFFHSFLVDQSTKIQITLKDSIKQVYLIFLKFSKIKINFEIILNKFIILNNNYCNLISLLVLSLPSFTNNKIIIVYKKHLHYLNKVEYQTAKILFLMVIQKLNKIIKLKQFYGNNIKNHNFLCLNTISLREYIQLVSIKKE